MLIKQIGELGYNGKGFINYGEFVKKDYLQDKDLIRDVFQIDCFGSQVEDGESEWLVVGIVIMV